MPHSHDKLPKLGSHVVVAFPVDDRVFLIVEIFFHIGIIFGIYSRKEIREKIPMSFIFRVLLFSDANKFLFPTLIYLRGWTLM